MRVCLSPLSLPKKELGIESERIIMIAIVVGLCVQQYPGHFM